VVVALIVRASVLILMVLLMLAHHFSHILLVICIKGQHKEDYGKISYITRC